MNYVIEVKDSDFPQDMLEKKWTDDSSDKKYEKVGLIFNEIFSFEWCKGVTIL